MSAQPDPHAVACTQCGGELHPDEGQIFLTCPFCNSTVYLDKRQVVFHWYLAPTLDEAQGRASLARWMAGNQTVKDLDKKSRLMGSTFQYFPMWYFKRLAPGGKEGILLEPAAAISISELRSLKLPAGDLRKYDPGLASQAVEPTVPLDAVSGWLQEKGIPTAELSERALVHIPLYLFKYQFQGKEYTALVEAGTGSVFANIFPAKAEAPYLLAGGAAALVYLCLATLPVLGATVEFESYFPLGLGVCLGLGILAAPLLFALAAWVAAKV